MTVGSEYPNFTREEFLKGVGNTPLVKIESLSKEIGRNVYFKAEYENSGKSIKDRAVMYLLEDQINAGNLSDGGTIVEATAGNTGIGLCLLANSYKRGFKVRLYLPKSIIAAKINCLKSLGAEVVLCEPVPPSDPNFPNTLAKVYAKTHENTIHLNQFENLSNRRSHYETTGPEIWEQIGGKVDGFTCGAGTGGTFSGIATYLKEQDPTVKAYLADKEGSGFFSYITSKGESWDHEGGSFVEGIGGLGLTGQLHDVLDVADGAFQIPDREVIVMIYSLIAKDNIKVGASGGLNICAAKKLALSLPEGSNVVTTVADGCERYASKLFNKDWLMENGHWCHIPEELKWVSDQCK